MNNKRNWTEQETKFLDEYEAGATIQEISEKINRTPNAVAQKLFRVGIIREVSDARGYELIVRNSQSSQKKENNSGPRELKDMICELKNQIKDLQYDMTYLCKEISKIRVNEPETVIATNSVVIPDNANIKWGDM